MSTWLISGSSGLVGTRLVQLLRHGDHTVVRLVRRRPNGPDEIAWDPATHALPDGALDGVDVVVNLSGETIGGRFTDEHRAAILRSRLDATTTLAEALAADPGSRTLVQASAIGFYGPRRPGELLTEGSTRGDGFLADVVATWERASRHATAAGVRTVLLRTGIVLSGNGGVLQQQLPLFRLGLGGPLTRRDAWLSWISLEDLARAYVHAGQTPSLSGRVNAVGPEPVTQGQFAKEVGAATHRPSWLPTPAVGPMLLLGRQGYDELVNTDQRVSSARLEGSGFEFLDRDVTAALHRALA